VSLINITIDNIKVRAEEGITILDAAKGAGIEIPTLCTYAELEPYGACRMCVVEIEGMDGYPTSCTTSVEQGMVVKTKSPEVIELRKNILKLLLSGHTSPCIVCLHKEDCEKYRPNPAKSGKTVRCESCSNREPCELRKLAEEYKVDDLELPIIYQNLPLERMDPFMDRDYNLCILCGRCVRICKKIHEKGTIDFINRGKDTRIGAAFLRNYVEAGCRFCGACIDICPTGALSDRFAKWHGEADRTEETTCDICPAGCPVRLKMKNGRVIGAESTAFTDEARLCAIGRFILPQVYEEPDHLNAAVQKIVRLSSGHLIQNIISDIERKMGTSRKKADIISALGTILDKKNEKHEETPVVTGDRLFKIVSKTEIVPNTHMIEVFAPDIAKKCQPGQFVIAMVNERSERIPYTIADWDDKKGTVTIHVMEAGRSSREMLLLDEGEFLLHFVGPLGMPVEIKKYGTVVCGGGCFGVGAILPIARALKDAGNKVICIEEASSGYLLYWQDKLSQHCDELIIATKDGSVGLKGGVQEVLLMLTERGEELNQAFIIGCTFMMMLVSEATKGLGIPTLTALNPIMVDGTGMCGACRVTVGDETKFACVDGPFFDGHLIDWVELMQRRSAYTKLEVEALPQEHDGHDHAHNCMI